MRIEEKMLILPTLYIINLHTSVTMSDLIRELTGVFNPTGEDAKILNKRKDTKFSQKIRNLKSHRDTNGMDDFTNLVDGRYTLSEKGKEYLNQNIYVVEYLFSNKFKYEDVQMVINEVISAQSERKSIYVYDENDMVSEGEVRKVETITKKRSRRLREATVQHYTRPNGKIYCEVCGFCFEDKYGDLGKGFMEIHHEEPIFQYSDDGFESYIREAVTKMKPVCPNCHRMIHRYPKNPLTIDDLKHLIK